MESTRSTVETVRGDTPPQTRTPATRDELDAFTTVVKWFAIAWIVVTLFRELARGFEIYYTKGERIAEKDREIVKSIIAALGQSLAKPGEPRTVADLVGKMYDVLQAVERKFLQQ